MDGGEADKSLGGLMPPSPFAATHSFPLLLKGAREGLAAHLGGVGEAGIRVQSAQI